MLTERTSFREVTSEGEKVIIRLTHSLLGTRKELEKLKKMNAFPQYWWHDYRRERYRPRTRLGHELICRKTLSESMIDFTRHCSLSGINKLCDSNLEYKVR